MRLLMLNPNSSAAMTEFIAEQARRHASPGTEIAALTTEKGPPVVTGEGEYALASSLMPGMVRRHGGTVDVVALSCFGDPGLRASREVSPCPVIGLAEASFRAARAKGWRCGIVTGGQAWVGLLENFSRDMGFADSLARVRALPATGAELFADPERALALVQDVARLCRDEDGADCLILGGSVLAGMGAAVEKSLGLPVIDPIEAAVRLAESI
ncbi:aspartate/glutamate racemase family protein [Telmatospirillum sp. J64-1]|uniref:aspartate/glutamate racemase family protein n=1 Tax=Telmatospirillum sp. J64-1 TaxID=2502183 RepID=UPI00115E10C8|nr:aspartate/glutamate racemase family protein [Telmatospirillum sp. J64-1]